MEVSVPHGKVENRRDLRQQRRQMRTEFERQRTELMKDGQRQLEMFNAALNGAPFLNRCIMAVKILMGKL
jgi:hypothetical protein